MPHDDIIDHATLSAIVQDVADAIVVVDADSTVRYANGAVADLFGHDPDDLVGRSYDVLIPQDLREAHDGHHDAFMGEPSARPMGEGLFLRARHADGFDFDVTVALVPVRSEPPLVAAIVREVTSSQRAIARLSATNDLLTIALTGASRQEVEERAVVLARGVLDAHSAWLVTMADDDVGPQLVAESGASAPEWLAGEPAERWGEHERVLDCPIEPSGTSLHMIVEREEPAAPFEPLDQQVLCEFAGAVAITTELVDARVEVDLLRSLADHDRIARDLHDRVIQRLFVVAMRLESVVATVPRLAQERIGEAVDSLDDVIREIRTTIFDLRRSGGNRGLRAAVAAEIDEVARSLGFAPSLRFIGSADDAVADLVEHETPVVVRELLANSLQHSRATTIDVTVSTDDGRLLVVVDDDGIGVGAARPGRGGNGLGNLQQRAVDFGGDFTVSEREPGGTRAVWSVPLAGRSQ